MKRILFIGCTCLFTQLVKAQEPADALRFSWTNPGGTARQQAIGGAMGSLGGDISATFTNPAGLAFYKTGDLVITPLYRFGKTKANYFDRTETDTRNKFNLGTSGFVIGSGSQGRNVRNTALSFAFNRSADFNNNTLYRGSNTQSSYSQKFLEEIQNENVRDANKVGEDYPFGTSLAFNTFWIDTIAGGTSGNYQFQSRAQKLLGTGLVQEQRIRNRGGVNEFAFGGAVNLNDNVMLGGTLGVPVLRYEREASFTEADATNNTNNDFDYATFTESLQTRGVGVNLKAGVIFKIQDALRLGFAFHTPTLYNLTDNYEAQVTTDTENYQGEWSDYSKDYTNDAPSEFKYTLVTPYRLMGSVSYVLSEVEDVTRQKGFLTADVEYVNYKAASFQENTEDGFEASNGDYLKSLNTAIDNAYKGALNVRVGGELKFTTFMVRAGVAYFGNPYQDINGEKGNRLNVSGGVGYRNRGFFVDLTYVHSIQKDVHFPYRLERSPYTGANLTSNMGNALLTFGIKL